MDRKRAEHWRRILDKANFFLRWAKCFLWWKTWWQGALALKSGGQWSFALYEELSIVFSNSLYDVTSPQEDVVGLVKHLLATEELSKGACLQIPLLTNTDIFHFIVGCIYNIFIFIIIIL